MTTTTRTRTSTSPILVPLPMTSLLPRGTRLAKLEQRVSRSAVYAVFVACAAFVACAVFRSAVQYRTPSAGQIAAPPTVHQGGEYPETDPTRSRFPAGNRGRWKTGLRRRCTPPQARDSRSNEPSVRSVYKVFSESRSSDPGEPFSSLTWPQPPRRGSAPDARETSCGSGSEPGSRRRSTSRFRPKLRAPARS